MDLEMRNRHEEIREDDKKMLREQLQAIKGAHTEAIKAAQVSNSPHTSLPQSARSHI
jgi:hypothetical protein